MLDLRLFRSAILLGISLLGVQGTIYLLQLVAAAKMAPAEYSTVRIIESLSAIGAQLATFGLPSIALVRIGVAKTDEQRQNLIRRCLLVVVAFGAAASIVFLIVPSFGFLRDQLGGFTPAMIALSASIAFRLLLTAITQSRQHYQRLAALSVIGCVASLATYFGFYIAGQSMEGWLYARLVLEGLICIGIVVTELGRFAVQSASRSSIVSPTAEEITLISLAGLAFPVGGSLVARSLVDNGPVLWLASLGVVPQAVARFGVVITIVTIAMVLSGVIQGVAVPRLAHNIDTGGHRGGYARLFGVFSLLTGVAFAIMIVASHLALPWAGLMSWQIILPGAIIVVSKTAASAMGGYLLVVNRGKSILVLNGITLGLAVVAAATAQTLHLTPPLPLLLTILAVIETVAAGCYGVVALLASKQTRGQSTALPSQAAEPL